jgi:4-amino-4-deoxy-L-arabinose transferase-like glycosyltransferase
MVARAERSRLDTRLLLFTFATKAAVLAIGYVALWSVIGHPPGFVEPWDRWDAPHYTDIAVFGYMANDPGTLVHPGYRQIYPGDADLYIVFFPLFPWLVALVDALLDAPAVSAFVVATIASLAVAPVLYRLVAADLGHRIGLVSALFLLIFPTAYFLHIGYTESLFLALSFGSLWLARTNRWWLAGIASALAGLTRINGLILVPALAVEAWLDWRANRRVRLGWLAIAGAAIGFAIYLGINLAVYGDAFQFAFVQRSHWFKELSWPWEGIGSILAWYRVGDVESILIRATAEIAFVVIGLVATVATLLRHRPTWGVWMAGNWLLFVSTTFVQSVPRYSLVLFGIVVWAAVIAERRPAIGWLLAAGSIATLASFAWRFGAGQWAF